MSMNATIVSGDDLNLNITAKRSSGDIIDLTGVTLKFSLFNTSGTEVLSKTTSSGITITDAAAGEFTVVINSADTAALDDLYKAEIQITDGLGKITTLRNLDKTVGIFNILKDYIV